jgi:hypothetical protein
MPTLASGSHGVVKICLICALQSESAAQNSHERFCLVDASRGEPAHPAKRGNCMARGPMRGLRFEPENEMTANVQKQKCQEGGESNDRDLLYRAELCV